MSATLALAHQSFDPRTLGAMHMWLSGEINGNAGNTWSDLSGSGNDGTLTNGPTYSADNGGVITLDGVNDYVATGLSANAIGQAWTIALWVKPTNAQSTRGIFAIQTQSNAGSPRILFQRENSTGTRWYMAGGYRISHTTTDNVFTHFAITYDGTIYRAYKNGAADGTYTGAFVSTSTTPEPVFWIGNGFNGYFSGSFGDFLIYKSTLGADAVAAIYQRSRFRYA